MDPVGIGPGWRALRPGHWLLVGVLSASLACGTLLYPERRGRDEPERLDPAVIVMDGALLFFFLVPGVVAFAVDIATGAIYEPEGKALARRHGKEPLRMTTSQARRLSVEVAGGPGARRPGPIAWETADGRRIPTAVVAGPMPGRYRVESGVALEPGSYRLVLAGADGSEHRVPVAIQ